MKIERRMSRPLSEILRDVATAVAEGQREMDRNALAARREIEKAVEDGELEQVIDSPWYRFSEVDVDLDLALEMAAKAEVDEQGETRAFKLFPLATPTMGGTRHRSEIDSELTAEISAKLVAVPPERRGDER